MGRVEPVPRAVGHKDGARSPGMLRIDREHGIAGVFHPVHEVVAGGDAGAPLAALLQGAGVIIGIVAATKLHDLVDRNLLEVVGLRSAGQHRFVAHVGEGFQVAGCRQPHGPVHAFVEEVPEAAFEPDCRRAAGAVRDRLTGGEPDVERASLVPLGPVR